MLDDPEETRRTSAARLEQALTGFDRARIHTIHGFAHRLSGGPHAVEPESEEKEDEGKGERSGDPDESEPDASRGGILQLEKVRAI